MTLVASFCIESHPVLIGDLFVSRWFDEAPPATPFNVPTFHDVNSELPPEWGYLVTGLRQKVSLFGDRLALGWTGHQLAARVAFEEIEKEAVRGTLSLERLQPLLASLEDGTLELGIVGFAIEPDAAGRLGAAGFAWDSASGWIDRVAVSAATGPVYAGGGGIQLLLRVLDSVTSHPKASHALTRAEAAELCAVSVGSILSGEQMRTGEGLASLYGGGFEIATVTEGRVRKLGAVTHFFLSARQLESGIAAVDLHRAITYDYQDDVLLVGTLELQMQWEWDARREPMNLSMTSAIRGEPAVYAIYPVHRPPSAEERERLVKNPPVMQFHTRFTAIYVHLPQCGGVVRSLVHRAGETGAALGMTLLGDKVDVSISSSTLRKISNLLTRDRLLA